MKKLIFVLVLVVIAGCGKQARAAASGIFQNTTATNVSQVVYVENLGVVTCHTPSPAFGCRSTVIAWSYSANSGLDYIGWDNYSGRMPGAVKDLPATHITHIKVTKISRKTALTQHRSEQVYYNVK